MPRIAIDPGHGGVDPGAINSKTTEKEMNLIVALKLNDLLLNQGFDVQCSRYTDKPLDLITRANMSNKFNADIFISVHHNAAGNVNADGFDIIHSLNPDDDIFAEYLAQEFEKIGQNKHKVFTKRSDKNAALEYYSVLRNTKAKLKIISEYCFLDSKDYEIADTVEELHREAQAIANAIFRLYQIKPSTELDELKTKVKNKYSFSDETVSYLANYKYSIDLLKKLLG